MFYVAARFAFPSHGMLLLRPLDLAQRIHRRISNCFEGGLQRLERRVHKSSSIC
jgi:hypothetical protein